MIIIISFILCFNVQKQFQSNESTNGNFKRLKQKGNQNGSNGDETYSTYDQIPKELLRDLTRSANFHHLKEESKRQK